MIEPYFQDSHVTIYHGDCRVILPQLQSESISCCCTSPPYFGLRRYTDNPTELGLEETPAAYVAALTGVFEEVRRVLRADGSLWLNLGDSYASAWAVSRRNIVGNGSLENGSREFRPNRCVDGLKEKDLIGIPWRVAFALQEAGWWLRSDCIWNKPSCMPESVTDRPTRSHEYVFLLSKAANYYYDAAAIAEPTTGHDPGTRGVGDWNKLADHADMGIRHGKDGSTLHTKGATRNKRTVWTVSSTGFPGAHFAVFPEKLIEPCILAGCPVGGVVLDPFMGSGTTLAVAKRLGRRAVGIEQSLEYCRMAAERLAAIPEPFNFDQAEPPEHATATSLAQNVLDLVVT